MFCLFILSSTSWDFWRLVVDKDLDRSPSGLRKYWGRGNKTSPAWIVLYPNLRLSGGWSLGVWSMPPLLFSEAPLFIYGLSSESPAICTGSALIVRYYLADSEFHRDYLPVDTDLASRWVVSFGWTGFDEWKLRSNLIFHNLWLKLGSRIMSMWPTSGFSGLCLLRWLFGLS